MATQHHKIFIEKRGTADVFELEFNGASGTYNAIDGLGIQINIVRADNFLYWP